MTNFQLFAVEDAGPRPLPVPEGATQFADLYRVLPLGVYDAFRTFEHNKFLYLNRHLARTERSMALLGWNYRLDRARLLRALHGVTTASEWPEMRVRYDVLADPVTLVDDPAQPVGSLWTRSRELIAIQPFTPPPPELYERGVAVAFAAGVRRDHPLAKTAEFAARRPTGAGLQALEVTADGRPPTAAGTTNDQRPPAASRGAEDAGLAMTGEELHGEDSPAAGGGQRSAVAPYEYLLLDPANRILEGAGTNFWAVRNGVVYTAAEGVLEGITREILLKLIPDLGLELRLAAVGADEIGALDEAALSGSSRAFLPVVEIAGQPVGDGRPGPISRRILAAYNDFVAANVKTAV